MVDNQVNIGQSNSRRYLGNFDSSEEVSEAYQKARKDRDEMYYKEFAQQQLKNKI